MSGREILNSGSLRRACYICHPFGGALASTPIQSMPIDSQSGICTPLGTWHRGGSAADVAEEWRRHPRHRREVRCQRRDRDRVDDGPGLREPRARGLRPQLALGYDAGAGNGPFGFGWTLALPAITRKTDKGLPRYADFEESDVFVLSARRTSSPSCGYDGSRDIDTSSAPGYAVHRYRPRVEGQHARIERWTRVDTGETHWRSISRDDVVTFYGRTPESRVHDPGGPGSRLLLAGPESFDDRGNGIAVPVRGRERVGVDVARASEGQRERGAVRYPKRIRYGNTGRSWPRTASGSCTQAPPSWMRRTSASRSSSTTATAITTSSRRTRARQSPPSTCSRERRWGRCCPGMPRRARGRCDRIPSRRTAPASRRAATAAAAAC